MHVNVQAVTLNYRKFGVYMLVMEDKKVSFRLDLPAELVEKSDEVFRLAGMTRTEGTTRLMEWFNSAPNEVHLLVFGVLEGRMQEQARRILLDMWELQTRDGDTMAENPTLKLGRNLAARNKGKK